MSVVDATSTCIKMYLIVNTTQGKRWNQMLKDGEVRGKPLTKKQKNGESSLLDNWHHYLPCTISLLWSLQ